MKSLKEKAREMKKEYDKYYEYIEHSLDNNYKEPIKKSEIKKLTKKQKKNNELTLFDKLYIKIKRFFNRTEIERNKMFINKKFGKFGG